MIAANQRHTYYNAADTTLTNHLHRSNSMPTDLYESKKVQFHHYRNAFFYKHTLLFSLTKVLKMYSSKQLSNRVTISIQISGGHFEIEILFEMVQQNLI